MSQTINNSSKTGIQSTQQFKTSAVKESVASSASGITQVFGHPRRNPLALSGDLAARSIENLNQLLADVMTLRDLYKKHHWQVSGPTFYMLHLLFDKHYEEQSKLVDLIAERVQALGGVTVAMAADVAEMSTIPRAPRGREESTHQIERLLAAHEIVLLEARAMAREAQEGGDDGTNDLIISNIVRTNELQAWFLVEHIQPTKVL